MTASVGSPGVLMLLGNNPYPQDARVRNEALALVAAGYRVAVICPRADGQRDRESVRGVRVYRYEAPPEAQGFVGYVFEYLHATLQAFRLSVRVLREVGFEVVHAHNPPDTLALVGAVYKLLGKRFVFDHHDIAPEMYDARFGAAAKRIVRAVLVTLEVLSCRLADRIIATNESYRTLEVQRARVSPDRVTIVRNGPGLGGDGPVAPDADLRARARVIVGYLGVMGYQDGIDHLLRAMHHLVYDLGRRDVLCVLIGKGDAHAELQRLATELALDDHVWFTGYVPRDDAARYLSTADLCVDPDPSNPFTDRSTMIKVMDYMSFGRPIVAFDLPENKFTAGSAAVYVRPNDDEQLARAIAELADDPERRAEMGASGLLRVRTELTWSRSSAQLVKAYREVLSPAGTS